VAQHTRVEDLRDIAEARNLVRAGTTGVELAIAGPERLFEGEETLALQESAFDLAVIDGGIDGVAYILLVFSTSSK
jgi:hypothetical protein